MNSRSQRRANQKRPANALLALLLAVCLFGTLTLPVFAQDGEGVSLQQAEPASTVETAAPDDGQDPNEETPTQTGDPAALQGETDETEQTDGTEPAAPQDGTEETDETEPSDPATPETAQPGDTVALQQVMNFAQGDLTVQVSIEGDAVVAEAPLAEPAQAERIDAQNVEPVQAYARSAANVATAENAAQETPADQATLQVAVLPQSEPEYQQARDYLRENGSEDVLSLSAMRLDFYYQDQPLDVSACTVTLTIDAGDTLVQQARQVAAEADAAQDAKVGVEFVALQSRNGQAEKLQSAFVDGDADQAPQLDVTLTGAQPVLMLASNEASLKLDEAMSATAETEEEKKSQQNKIDVAMGLISNMRPMYERFAELQAPESYAEAHELVKTGATASSEVLRLTVEIAEAAKKENGAAEALVLQAEMEEYTSDAQNFSKGLEMVLGDVVGTGTETGSTQP